MTVKVCPSTDGSRRARAQATPAASIPPRSAGSEPPRRSRKILRAEPRVEACVRRPKWARKSPNKINNSAKSARVIPLLIPPLSGGLMLVIFEARCAGASTGERKGTRRKMSADGLDMAATAGGEATPHPLPRLGAGDRWPLPRERRAPSHLSLGRGRNCAAILGEGNSPIARIISLRIIRTNRLNPAWGMESNPKPGRIFSAKAGGNFAQSGKCEQLAGERVVKPIRPRPRDPDKERNRTEEKEGAFGKPPTIIVDDRAAGKAARTSALGGETRFRKESYDRPAPAALPAKQPAIARGAWSVRADRLRGFNALDIGERLARKGLLAHGDGQAIAAGRKAQMRKVRAERIAEKDDVNVRRLERAANHIRLFGVKIAAKQDDVFHPAKVKRRAPLGKRAASRVSIIGVLRPGRRFFHALGNIGLEFGEVLDEHFRELLRLSVILRGLAPGVARGQDPRVDAGDLGRNVEAESFVLAHRRRVERAVERGGEQRARRLDRHPRAFAESAAGPAGIDQPAGRLVALDQLAQKLSVFGRMARHERRAEAGRERRLRLLAEALFGAGDLGGEAGEEVIHRLFGRKAGDRRQHAEGVGRQHDDVFRVRRAPRVRRGRDIMDRIKKKQKKQDRK